MQKTKNPLIFIIEDSVVYKDLIVGHLQSKKFTNVKTFEHPNECIKELELKPDIIVLDYTFGGMSGLELMKKVKAEHPEIDFIFISGQNDVETAVKLIKIGAADYIVKNEKSPYRLVSAIENLLLVTKTKKMNKGFQIGVVGFFLMLFLVIVLIILITIVFNL